MQRRPQRAMLRLMLALTLLLCAVASVLAVEPSCVRVDAYPSGFTHPLATAFIPQAGSMTGPDPRLFVVTKSGVVHAIPDASRDDPPSQYLDLASSISSSGGLSSELGLLSLVFHPDFAHNHRLFTLSTRDAGGLTVAIHEYTADAANSTSVSAATERLILQVPQPYPNHNGGSLLFGRDGMLYASIGDGGGSDDPANSGQDRTTLLGAMLRLNVTRTDLPYEIPLDNPFVGEGGGVREEIFAYGLRNPWKCSFNYAIDDTELLICGDVGQNSREELDVIVSGGNYGWKLMEGRCCRYLDTSCFSTLPDGLRVDPIAEYGRDDGRSIIGGHMLSGPHYPSQLHGRYLYADYTSKRLMEAVHTGNCTWQSVYSCRPDQVPASADLPGPVLSMGVAHDGLLLVLTDANVFRVNASLCTGEAAARCLDWTYTTPGTCAAAPSSSQRPSWCPIAADVAALPSLDATAPSCVDPVADGRCDPNHPPGDDDADGDDDNDNSLIPGPLGAFLRTVGGTVTIVVLGFVFSVAAALTIKRHLGTSEARVAAGEDAASSSPPRKNSSSASPVSSVAASV